MKLGYCLQVAGFIIGAVVLYGLLTMDGKTTASVIVSVALCVYLVLQGAVLVVRGLLHG